MRSGFRRAWWMTQLTSEILPCIQIRTSMNAVRDLQLQFLDRKLRMMLACVIVCTQASCQCCTRRSSLPVIPLITTATPTNDIHVTHCSIQTNTFNFRQCVRGTCVFSGRNVQKMLETELESWSTIWMVFNHMFISERLFFRIREPMVSCYADDRRTGTTCTFMQLL